MSVDQNKKTQLELGPTREKEPDRNYHRGGRSFYFFDFDDNIAFLTTPLVLFHKKTKEELFLSSGEWATHHQSIGKSGIYEEFEIDWEEKNGTFRYFRDLEFTDEDRQTGKKQTFVQDILSALSNLDSMWKGPSWDCFYHAVFNQRPIAVITARGHSAETIRAGIYEFVKAGFLPAEPNYLCIFAVSNKQVREMLGDKDFTASTAELKQKAIRASFEKAVEVYGYSQHHRFGMSDDDPKNIQLIVEEMTRLKSRHPEVSFFMIETHGGSFIKHEVNQHGLSSPFLHDGSEQLDLFTQLTRHKA